MSYRKHVRLFLRMPIRQKYRWPWAWRYASTLATHCRNGTPQPSQRTVGPAGPLFKDLPWQRDASCSRWCCSIVRWCRWSGLLPSSSLSLASLRLGHLQKCLLEIWGRIGIPQEQGSSLESGSPPVIRRQRNSNSTRRLWFGCNFHLYKSVKMKFLPS